MPDRLYFTDSDEANTLIASDPMALLIGFALDQQVTVEKAFAGPLASTSASGRSTRRSPQPTSSPCSARNPRSTASPRDGQAGARSRRPHPGRVRRRRRASLDRRQGRRQLRANLAALPGFGEMKVKSLGAVLAKRYGIKRQEARATPPHARRRRLAAGAHRLPGGEEGAQSGVDEDEGQAVAGVRR